MIDKFKKTIQQASDLILEQAGNLGDSALEKTTMIFEDWATVFPQLELYGLEMINFSLSVGLSPAMTIYMCGQTTDFEEERLKELLADNKGEKTMLSVLKTIQTTYQLYDKTGGEPFEKMHLWVKVGLSPEIKVTFGELEFG